MSEQENVQAVQQLYEAFRQRDIPAVLNCFAEEVVLYGPAPAGVLPWGGMYRGREGVGQFFKVLGESLDIQLFEIRDFIAQGDKVIVLGYQRGRAKSTGKPYETHFAIALTLRDGKVAEYRSYNDTTALAAALRGV